FRRQDHRVVHGRGEAENGSPLDGVADRGDDTAWAAEFQTHVLRLALDRSRPHFREDTWRAFELVWLENRPAAQVAAALGQPLDWVYVAKSRVLKQLWQEVRELA